MKILIMGGTGAMGVPLVKYLSEQGNIVYVTSRKAQKNEERIIYIKGNAKDITFLKRILNEGYDVIIDFMVYDTLEFKNRVEMLLSYTKQYIFISSARCYANSMDRITESSIRLLDSIEDNDYMLTDDYALAKARQENILYSSLKRNWTIIRPYITYNSQRLQLCCYEKEFWLYRILKNKTIILPEDILDSVTTLTFGFDVATCIGKLTGNKTALGQCYTVATTETHTWREILYYYSEIIYRKSGKKIKTVLIPDSKEMYGVCDKYQIKYDRIYGRSFNIEKIQRVLGDYTFTTTYEGLEQCLENFLSKPCTWGRISAKFEAWSDRHSHEFSSLKEFKGLKEKFRYIKWRFLSKP